MSTTLDDIRRALCEANDPFGSGPFERVDELPCVSATTTPGSNGHGYSSAGPLRAWSFLRRLLPQGFFSQGHIPTVTTDFNKRLRTLATSGVPLERRPYTRFDRSASTFYMNARSAQHSPSQPFLPIEAERTAPEVIASDEAVEPREGAATTSAPLVPANVKPSGTSLLNYVLSLQPIAGPNASPLWRAATIYGYPWVGGWHVPQTPTRPVASQINEFGLPFFNILTDEVLRAAEQNTPLGEDLASVPALTGMPLVPVRKGGNVTVASHAQNMTPGIVTVGERATGQVFQFDVRQLNSIWQQFTLMQQQQLLDAVCAGQIEVAYSPIAPTMRLTGEGKFQLYVSNDMTPLTLALVAQTSLPVSPALPTSPLSPKSASPSKAFGPVTIQAVAPGVELAGNEPLRIKISEADVIARIEALLKQPIDFSLETTIEAIVAERNRQVGQLQDALALANQYLTNSALLTSYQQRIKGKWEAIINAANFKSLQIEVAAISTVEIYEASSNKALMAAQQKAIRALELQAGRHAHFAEKERTKQSQVMALEALLTEKEETIAAAVTAKEVALKKALAVENEVEEPAPEAFLPSTPLVPITKEPASSSTSKIFALMSEAAPQSASIFQGIFSKLNIFGSGDDVLISINYPEALTLTEDQQQQLESKSGLTTTSPAGIQYQLIKQPEKPVKAQLKRSQLQFAENESIEESQQRLAVTVINMIDNVLAQSDELHIRTCNPFIASIAEAYVDFLKKDAALKLEKTSLHLSVEQDEEAHQKGQTVMQRLMEKGLETEWAKSAARQQMIDYRASLTLAPKADASVVAQPAAPQRMSTEKDKAEEALPTVASMAAF